MLRALEKMVPVSWFRALLMDDFCPCVWFCPPLVGCHIPMDGLSMFDGERKTVLSGAFGSRA